MCLLVLECDELGMRLLLWSMDDNLFSSPGAARLQNCSACCSSPGYLHATCTFTIPHSGKRSCALSITAAMPQILVMRAPDSTCT